MRGASPAWAGGLRLAGAEVPRSAGLAGAEGCPGWLVWHCSVLEGGMHAGLAGGKWGRGQGPCLHAVPHYPLTQVLPCVWGGQPGLVMHDP